MLYICDITGKNAQFNYKYGIKIDSLNLVYKFHFNIQTNLQLFL